MDVDKVIVKVFGGLAYGCSGQEQKRSKYDRCCAIYHFLSYSDHEKTHQFDALSNGQIVVSRDA